MLVSYNVHLTLLATIEQNSLTWTAIMSSFCAKNAYNFRQEICGIVSDIVLRYLNLCMPDLIENLKTTHQTFE